LYCWVYYLCGLKVAGMELDKIYSGDCLDVLQGFDDNCVDAVITDPPYELGFMGKKWDNTGIACVNLNRRFVLIEKEPEYITIAEKRITEAQRQYNEKNSQGKLSFE
jgi:DNA modification methylase